MANFSIFLMRLLLVTMTLAAAAAYVQVEQISPNGDDYAYPPENNDDLPPEQSPEERKFLDGCVKHFTRECGREIFVNMFEHYGPVTDTCCSQLVAAGETCHITMVKALFVLPEFQSKASSGIPKSKQIWNECAWIVSRESPSPSAIPLEN
ncbi:hypothetical protein SLE2022_271370 [Rubroshorea leprosula]